MFKSVYIAQQKISWLSLSSRAAPMGRSVDEEYRPCGLVQNMRSGRWTSAKAMLVAAAAVRRESGNHEIQPFGYRHSGGAFQNERSASRVFAAVRAERSGNDGMDLGGKY